MLDELYLVFIMGFFYFKFDLFCICKLWLLVLDFFICLLVLNVYFMYLVYWFLRYYLKIYN